MHVQEVTHIQKRSMLLIDLKAFLYGAVFDFLYIPIRVTERAFASLSGRTDR